MKKDIQLANLKDEYVKYFADVPIQKYAAQFIMRDEDTIIRWKTADTNFADRVKRAEAEYIRKRLLETKAEFALERLFNSAFKPTHEIEIKQEQRMPVYGTGTTFQLRQKFIQMVKDEIRNGKPSDRA